MVKYDEARTANRVKSVLHAWTYGGLMLSARRIADECGIHRDDLQLLKRTLSKLVKDGVLTAKKVKCNHKVTPRDGLFGGCATGVHYENRYCLTFAPLNEISVESVTVDTEARDAGIAAYFAKVR